jgi:AraC family transcriptional regulator
VSKRLPQLDFRDAQSRASVLRTEAVRNSAGLGWESLYFEHREESAFETVEHVIQDHYLMVKLNPLSKAERTIDGVVRPEIQRRASTAYVPSGCPHRVRYAGQLGRLHLMTLSPSLVETVADEMGIGNVDAAPRFANEEDRFVLEVAQAIDAELAAGNPHGKLFAETFARTLAAHIVTRYRCQPMTTAKAPMLGERKLRGLERFIEANLAMPISLTELADQAGLSESYFCRCFKLATGLSPYQYVLKKRMDYACRCLQREDMSIQDAAFASGFGDPVQFAKQFRRAYGCTPSAYRAQHLSARMHKRRSI